MYAQDKYQRRCANITSAVSVYKMNVDNALHLLAKCRLFIYDITIKLIGYTLIE